MIRMIMLAVGLSMPGTAPVREPADLSVQAANLVKKHFPDATVANEDGAITVEFKCRDFQVHHPRLDGTYQDAFEERGPQPGGFYCRIEWQPGKYGGMAVLPQEFNRQYFKAFVMAPYSATLDKHLRVEMKYSKTRPAELVREIDQLFGEGIDKLPK
ncbi:hypothetical protein [Zavarzinella formosa]|uniref:hypothetical protein n=1 Tax=Zavarzinella formosa TaxID=360055 RepID=UPI0003616473|nr:hypothetical protein [Zavarzinella formosa]